MADITREEMDAKLAKAAADTELSMAEYRSDIRQIRDYMQRNDSQLKSLHTTIIVTAIGTLIGLAGIIVAMQANMISSFQSGVTAAMSSSK